MLTTRDGSNTLFSDRYGQTYHSKFGAETESRHVFLNGSGVRDRLEAGQSTRVLEVGFGAGLNFFLTADLALQQSTPLTYFAFENELLPAQSIAALNYEDLTRHSTLVKRVITWLASLPTPTPLGLHTCSLGDTLSLSLILGDAETSVFEETNFDAVYLDAFSPEANPELWTSSFFGRLGKALKPGGMLSTYSSRGSVRRNLIDAGFQVMKIPGPPGKRETIVAKTNN